METNIETPVSKTVKEIFNFLKNILGEEEAKSVKTEYEKFIAHSSEPSGFTWESIGTLFVYLHEKFPRKETEITNFRMLVNRAERTRRAGFFFDKGVFYTIKDIIESFKNYFNYFKGWDDNICTYTEEEHGEKYFSFKFVTRVYNTNCCDYLNKCTIEFNEDAFFKDNKKVLLNALTRRDVFGIRDSVKKELREKTFESLLNLLPDDFFAMDDLTIKGRGKEITKKPCVKELSIGEQIAKEIAEIFKQHNFVFTWGEDILESKEKLSKFLAIINSFLYDIAADDSVIADIFLALRKGKDIYAKNEWQVFVENKRFCIIDTTDICYNLYKGALMFLRHLPKEYNATLKYTEESLEFTVEGADLPDDAHGRSSFTVVRNNITSNYNKLREKFFKTFFWIVPQSASVDFIEEFNKKTRS